MYVLTMVVHHSQYATNIFLVILKNYGPAGEINISTQNNHLETKKGFFSINSNVHFLSDGCGKVLVKMTQK